METPRHLDGTGKGEFDYDYKNDVLMFKIKNRDYKRSLEFQNFVIDIDTENYPTGIRIFDASKLAGIDRFVFKNLVHGEFNATIKDNVITVTLKFVGKSRNRIIPIFSTEENYTQQFCAPGSQKHPLLDSEVVVPEIVA